VRETQERGADYSYDLLSIREKELLQLLSSSSSNRQIADMIDVSAATVEPRRSTIPQKRSL
jgi:FixJ family two-component response regulator